MTSNPTPTWRNSTAAWGQAHSHVSTSAFTTVGAAGRELAARHEDTLGGPEPHAPCRNRALTGAPSRSIPDCATGPLRTGSGRVPLIGPDDIGMTAGHLGAGACGETGRRDD